TAARGPAPPHVAGAAPPRKPPPPPAPAPAGAASEAPGPASAETPAPAAPAQPEPAQSTNGRTFVSPVVAKIASEHGVDPSQVQGTGRGGRVTKKDILDFIESGTPTEAPPPPAPPPTPTPTPAPT